jgi:hypothetical protein
MDPDFENNVIYILFSRTVILPVFRENEEKIDKVVNQGKEKLAELAEKSMEDKKST